MFSEAFGVTFFILIDTWWYVLFFFITEIKHILTARVDILKNNIIMKTIQTILLGAGLLAGISSYAQDDKTTAKKEEKKAEHTAKKDEHKVSHEVKKDADKVGHEAKKDAHKVGNATEDAAYHTTHNKATEKTGINDGNERTK